MQPVRNPDGSVRLRRTGHPHEMGIEERTGNKSKRASVTAIVPALSGFPKRLSAREKIVRQNPVMPL